MSDKGKSDNNKDTEGFGGYAFSRIILVLIIVIAGFWVIQKGLSYLDKNEISQKIIEQSKQDSQPTQAPMDDVDAISQRLAGEPSGDIVHSEEGSHSTEKLNVKTMNEVLAKIETPRPTGVAFVEAAYGPLEYELKERFYGWRPNDYIKFTDNVNNIQKGVLEVTRKTAVNLFERISRTGSTVSFDQNLENAQNWFMIQSTRYYFPFFQSPEGKYRDGIEELKKYRNKLMRGEAKFYNRTDNLIPLLESYRNLLGSCDDNLVKSVEMDGESVSIFDADDYFYYAQGVASSIETVLKAVEIDFHTILLTRYGKESLDHAIESCHKAAKINPWVITDADLSGVLANHRANMATAISHARFHIGVLIRTLST